MNEHPHITDADLEIQPLERSETIPSAWYTDPAFRDFDKHSIFNHAWHNIGHISRLMNAGNYIIGTAAGNPVLVVRGQDETLRAFYNVCRHRGGPLAMEDGCGKVLQCKYHGWTYLLDGSLRGTPKFDRTELFDKKDYGLIPVALDVWEGLVFVNVDVNAPPVSDFFKGIADRIAPISLSKKKFYKRVTYNVHCNWKVYVDNYLEGYHLPFVHPELCNLLDFQQYVTETYDWYSFQYSPIQQEQNIYGDAGEMAYYYFVWPNFMLNILPDRLQTNLVLPDGHDKCIVLFDYYYDEIESEAARRRAEADIEYSHKIQLEDIEICEHVQNGLQSNAYDKGRFSVEFENAVHHFQSLVKRAYRKALTGR
ncbi:aromatic ring-hydroxylating dioxygenase subunit alpha [Sphingobacteriales bacterium CHB3]|nr:aromatic ring-hydroxylating dioxygenase subunit alpha [Sphingobacteriales bacterium CHB3]